MRNIFGAVLSGVAAIVFVGNALAEGTPLDRMISPVSNPVNFEDPRIQSNLRPIFVYHKLDDRFVTGGGDAKIYALQARFAVTDDLAIIATKDGYIDLNPDDVVAKDEGIADIAAGLKYAAWRNEDSSALLSVGLRYEFPLGDEEVLQGQGDGMINPFLSYAAAFDGWNFMAGTGARLRRDDSDSSFWDADLHVDFPVGSFYPLMELNFVHVISAGDRLPIPDEGFDFFNLGSSDADGKTMVTGAVGTRYRFCDNLDFGIAYQFPVTQGAGSRLNEWRVTTDLIYSF